MHLWRLASFAGSINREEFLKDQTGNRRFLVETIERVIFDEDLNVDDLYRQALYMYRNGYRTWFNPEEQKLVEINNQRYLATPMIADLLINHFKVPGKAELEKKEGIIYMQAGDIIAYLKEKYPTLTLNDGHAVQAGQALKKLGFNRKSKRKNGTSVYCWMLTEVFNKIIENEDGTPTDTNLGINHDDLPI
jgi:hypothetical protein